MRAAFVVRKHLHHSLVQWEFYEKANHSRSMYKNKIHHDSEGISLVKNYYHDLYRSMETV